MTHRTKDKTVVDAVFGEAIEYFYYIESIILLVFKLFNSLLNKFDHFTHDLIFLNCNYLILNNQRWESLRYHFRSCPYPRLVQTAFWLRSTTRLIGLSWRFAQAQPTEKNNRALVEPNPGYNSSTPNRAQPTVFFTGFGFNLDWTVSRSDWAGYPKLLKNNKFGEPLKVLNFNQLWKAFTEITLIIITTKEHK